MSEETKTATRELPNNADPVVDYTTAAARPGRLRGDANLVVQTRRAQQLVYGRRKTDEKEHITGLVRYGMNMKGIWNAASRDDPYADYALLRIENALTKARQTINTLRKETESLLENAAAGVQIDVAHSLEPVRIPLQFANAYGYMGAYVIADYDQLVCAILTARHVGLMPQENIDETNMVQAATEVPEAESELINKNEREPNSKQASNAKTNYGIRLKSLNNAATLIRHAFGLSALWKFTLVTRNDVRNNTPMAVKAKEAMPMLGELPQEIIDGSKRAKVAPAISPQRTPASEDDKTKVANPDDEKE